MSEEDEEEEKNGETLCWPASQARSKSSGGAGWLGRGIVATTCSLSALPPSKLKKVEA